VNRELHIKHEELYMNADACSAVATTFHLSSPKRRLALRGLVSGSSIHKVSILSFGLLFVRQRFGGGALVAKLAESLSSNQKHHGILMRRVFGGRAAQAISRSMRAEMIHMLQMRPVCAFVAILQVFICLAF
jgi:hypothetical protein